MRLPKNLFKYIASLFFVLLFRLTPHPPNVEPIMSTMMPFAKKWGAFAGVLFTLLALIIYDLVTGTLGAWSLLTIGTYCFIAFFASVFFKKRKSKTSNYVAFAVVATLFYDAVTGFGVGMLVFNQSFMQTLAFQIPFTLYHLLGNIVLSAVVSPLLYNWVVDNPKLETQSVLSHAKKLIVNTYK